MMLGRFTVALLILGSPAFAQVVEPEQPVEEVAAAAAAEAPPVPVAYKTKKVCRSVEVVGSSIPRTTCTTKKIPIKPKVEEAQASNQSAPQPEGQL